MIKTDFEKCGDYVWFDKREIKADDDWCLCISDSLKKGDNLLSFMSTHLTPDSVICSEEIAIAIGVKDGNIQAVLVESNEEVNSLGNLGHMQWFDMLNCKTLYKIGEENWNTCYNEKFSEIIHEIEIDESKCFSGDFYNAKGQESNALEFFEKSLKVMEELVALEPDRTDFRVDYAICHWNIYLLCSNEDKLLWLTKAKAILELLIDEGVTHGQLEELWGMVNGAIDKQEK